MKIQKIVPDFLRVLQRFCSTVSIASLDIFMSRHYRTSNFGHLDLRLLLKPAEGLLASLKGYYQDRSLEEIGTKLLDNQLSIFANFAF